MWRINCSLKGNTGFSATANLSQEDWCSIDFNFTFLIDVVSLPECWENSINVSISIFSFKMKVSSDNFKSSSFGISLCEPEVSIWKSVLLSLSGVLVIHGVHKSIVRFGLESVWDVSHVSVIATESVHVSWIFSIILCLNVLVIRWIRFVGLNEGNTLWSESSNSVDLVINRCKSEKGC